MKTMFVTVALVSFLSSPAFASPTQFECKGTKSGNFYDVTIVDVGDEEGEVVVNNGGAPQTFSAHYNETNEGHNFIFGFENYNEGITPQLSELTLKVSADGKTAKGRTEYFEHDYSSQSHQLIKESIKCKVIQ